MLPQSHKPLRGLRFLLTDSCNLRCTFCHNEFQGDVVAGHPHQWDYSLVRRLMVELSVHAGVRVKFSGGEPLLRFNELVSLLHVTDGLRAADVTVFTNLTLGTQARLAYLHSLGVARINANLPSFRSEVFASRTGRRRSQLALVLKNARIARSLGLRIQFNLVMPMFPDDSTLQEFLEVELREGLKQADAWDAISLVADDWLAAPASVRESIVSCLADRPDAIGPTHGRLARSYEFSWAGKQLLATRCTDWSMPEDVAEADIYVVPPGRVLSAFVRGQAYR